MVVGNTIGIEQLRLMWFFFIPERVSDNEASSAVSLSPTGHGASIGGGAKKAKLLYINCGCWKQVKEPSEAVEDETRIQKCWTQFASQSSFVLAIEILDVIEEELQGQFSHPLSDQKKSKMDGRLLLLTTRNLAKKVNCDIATKKLANSF
jgi:hypothetical protein